MSLEIFSGLQIFLLEIFFYLGFGNNSNALNIAREFNTKQVLELMIGGNLLIRQKWNHEVLK
jgi:hypothetical protein